MPPEKLSNIEVQKLNLAGEVTWSYSGRIMRLSADEVLLEAFFNRPDLPFHGIVMREGDRFVEKYFFQKWYNIFEIHDRDDDRIKAWYCNVSEPAKMQDSRLYYVDLALDLLAFPDGKTLILDEDEFAELNLEPETRHKAIAALEELKTQFSSAARKAF